jgi:hypothetical protein
MAANPSTHRSPFDLETPMICKNTQCLEITAIRVGRFAKETEHFQEIPEFGNPSA